MTARPRAGWHAYRPGERVGLPGWAVEVVLAVERPAWPEAGSAAGAVGWPLLLLRSTGRAPALARALGQAANEVEMLAGLGRPTPLRLPVPAPLAGAEPVGPGAVLGHLGMAASRGQPSLARRRAPVVAAAGSVWQAGPGAVVACAGPGGASAQAAIALGGRGDPAAITPRAGGALLLRAWRVGRRWGLVSALVLGAPDAGGLGRAAKGCVAELRAGGWAAAVATGAAALSLVRLGDPRCQVPPAARPADRREVAALLVTFVAAVQPATGPSRP